MLHLRGVSVRALAVYLQPALTENGEHIGDRPVLDEWRVDPPLTTFACTIPTESARSLRFLQGWVAMLRVLFDFVVDT